MTDQSTDPNRPATGVLRDVVNHITALFRKEIDLARAEASENVSRAFKAVGMLVGALVLALVALNVLAAALVSALTNLGLDGAWAALIVGGVLGIIAAILLLKGQNDLKATSLAPTRTTRSVRRDADTLREYKDSEMHRERTHGT